MIPNQLRGGRFIKVAENKAPIEKGWQKDTNYIYDGITQYYEKEKRCGVLCGINNLVVVDFDEKWLQDKVVPHMPRTFTALSANKGLMHKYFYVDSPESFKIMDLNKNTLADIQGPGKQVICPNSEFPNGNKSIVADDVPISTVKMADIKEWFKEFMISEQELKRDSIETDPTCKQIKDRITIPDILKKHGINTDRNPTDCPLHDSKGHRCFSYTDDVFKCFHCDAKGNVFQLVQLIDNCDFITAKKKLMDETGVVDDVDQKQEAIEVIEVKSYTQLLSFKDERKQIIEDMIPESSVNMIVSPPSHFKTMSSLYMALCISSGEPFLGKKTIQGPVLYCDLENGMIESRTRLEKLAKGLGIETKNLPLYYTETPIVLIGGNESLIKIHKNALIEKIKELGIKVVFMDTLHRFGAWDENSSNDVNELYTKLFVPLKKLGVAVVYLHHTNRLGEPRGSSDLIGNPDTIFTCNVKQRSDTEYTVIFKNYKMRNGVKGKEWAMDFTFDDDSIDVEETDYKESKVAKNLLCRAFTLDLIKKNKDISTQAQLLEKIQQMPSGGSEIKMPTLKKVMRELINDGTVVKELGFYKPGFPEERVDA